MRALDTMISDPIEYSLFCEFYKTLFKFQIVGSTAEILKDSYVYAIFFYKRNSFIFVISFEIIKIVIRTWDNNFQTPNCSFWDSFCLKKHF